MSNLHHYKVTTPSGSTTILQLSEQTAERDYPSAVRVGSPKTTPATGEEGKKAAEKPQNKAAPEPQNKSGE